ncbi:MAG: FixH family protein [Acidobacteria bacterium]|nr:FixH family protein [Candidatus Sulfomarinibacter sp. MAG AM1]
MKKGSLWPWIIAGALALHVVGSLVVVFVAASNSSYAVEEDYYQKALHWNDKRAQDRTNEELGWILNLTVRPAVTPGEQPTLEVHLAEAGGEPVDDAVVAVETFHNARADDILRARLDTVGEGVYRTTLPMRRNGRWELRFTVDHGQEHFTHAETRHLFVERGR